MALLMLQTTEQQQSSNFNHFRYDYTAVIVRGSVAEWLACWTQVQVGYLYLFLVTDCKLHPPPPVLAPPGFF